MGTDGEQLGAGADQQHFLITDPANQPAIDEIGEGNTLRQIRAARRSLFLGHRGLVLSSSSRGKEFLAKLRVVAEAAEHAAGDQIGVVLVHAACSHAVMRRPYDDADAQRLEHIIDSVGNLRGQLFLDLQALGVGFNDAGKLADADHAAIRNVGYARPKIRAM
jgi:hypothetical protein